MLRSLVRSYARRIGDRERERLTLSIPTRGCFLAAIGLLFPQASASAEVLLSQSDPGYAFVEQVQEYYCKVRPSHRCSMDRAECMEKYGQLWRQMFGTEPTQQTLAESCDQVSTTYELPGFYRFLTHLRDEVVATVVAAGLHRPGKLYVGSLPIRNINASVLAPEDIPGHFIFLNVRFFEFASELAKVAALSLPMKVEGDVISIDPSVQALESKLNENSEIRGLFLNRVLGFLELATMTQSLPPSLIQPILAQYQQGIELFAMSHEIAHVLLGHSGGLTLEDLKQAAESKKESESHDPWIQELEADYLAAQLVRGMAERRLRSDDEPLSEHLFAYTPQFYFTARRIIEQASALYLVDGVIPVPTASEWRAVDKAIECTKQAECYLASALADEEDLPRRHPHPDVRRKFVRSLLTGEPSSDEAEAMAETAKAMEGNVDHLWASILDSFSSPEGKELLREFRTHLAAQAKEEHEN